MHRLMIVDDSNIIRNRIERSCANSFEVVATATDGADAVKKFRAHKPQVVTMDLTMPNLDGLECIQELVAIDPEVIILVISAISDKSTGIKALELGASGFLHKPFTEEALVEALTEVLDQ